MVISIFPLISSIIFLTFAVAVSLSDTRTSIKKIFTALCLATFWWQFSWFVLFNTQDKEVASMLAKLGHIGILFLPVWLYHLTLVITRSFESYQRYILYAAYAFTIGSIVVLLTTDLLIQGIHEYSWAHYPQAGILHPVFIAVVAALMLCSLRLLWKSYRETRSVVKSQQIKYFLWAILFYNLSAIDFITNYGFNIYPVGFVFIVLFIVFIWQGISHHYLLNISRYFKIIASYIFVFLYSWVVAELFIYLYIENGDISPDGFDAVERLVAVAIFAGLGIALYQYSNKLIDYALGDYRNPNRLLIKIHEEIIECQTREELIAVMSQILSFIFPTDHAYVIKTSHHKEPEIICGEQSSKDHPLGISALTEFASKDYILPQEIITPETIKYFALPQGEQGQVLEQLRTNCVGLMAPMYHEEEFVGNIILGEKPYQEPFTDNEKRFIERIAPVFAKRIVELPHAK